MIALWQEADLDGICYHQQRGWAYASTKAYLVDPKKKVLMTKKYGVMTWLTFLQQHAPCLITQLNHSVPSS